MRIFIHNCNTYIGKALVKELRKDPNGLNRIFGCQTAAGGAPASIKKLTSRDDPKKAKRMEEIVRNSTTIIIDLFNCTLEDLYFLISALKVDYKSSPPRITGEILDSDGNRKEGIHLIIISSVMVWADTQLDTPAAAAVVEETEGTEEAPAAPDAEPSALAEAASALFGIGTEVTDEAQDAAAEGSRPTSARPKVLTETHFEQRRPIAGTKYEQWLQMEELCRSCFSQEGSQVKCFIVGAGVLYGDGEETFTQLFKDAWLGVRNHKIMSPGLNVVPTVHVRDLGRLVRQVAYNRELNPAEKPYFLAVDKIDGSSAPTQADIINGIVGEVNGPYDIPLVEPPPLPTPTEDPDDASWGALFGALKTRDGVGGQSLPSATPHEDGQMQAVPERDSLTEALSLNLTMEPSAIMLAEEFEWYCSGGLLKNIRKVAEEFCTDRQLRALRVIIAGPPGSGKTTLCKAVSEHFNSPHLEMQLQDLDATRQELCSEVCRYRGYVLDAQVAGFDEVEQLFCTDFEIPFTEEEEEANAAAAKEAEENGEEPPVVQPKTERRLSEAGIVPSFVVLLQAPEALCRARSKASGPVSENRFQKEMELYALRNLVDGEMNFSDFFQDFAKIGAFNLPIAGKCEEDLFESTRIYMESGQGRPFNYLKSTDEVAQELLEKKSEKELAEQFKAQEMKRQVSAGSKDKDAAVCKRRDERLRMISAHEEQRKQIDALPLRDYLMRYMVPNLTEGLIEMCRVMPENPTDYLANYLEEHAARSSEN